MLGAGLHGRSCPQMPASLPWSLFVFLNGSVVDLQHHVGCRCTARWFSYIYIVFIAHACTWKTHLWYTAVHVCVIRVHGAFFFSVRWPHALPWRPELRTSQDLPLRIRGAPGEGPAPRGGWLQPPTAAAPREAGPLPVRAMESQQCSQQEGLGRRDLGKNTKQGRFPKEKQSHTGLPAHRLEPCTEQAPPC